MFLFVGLLLWLTLVGRALWPALAQAAANRSRSSALLFLSTVCIGLFYGAGLMWGEHTHLSMVEYWRWWVVHLWVEGFFEVFATAVIAFLFTRLGLVRATHARRSRCCSRPSCSCPAACSARCITCTSPARRPR